MISSVEAGRLVEAGGWRRRTKWEQDYLTKDGWKIVMPRGSDWRQMIANTSGVVFK